MLPITNNKKFHLDAKDEAEWKSCEAAENRDEGEEESTAARRVGVSLVRVVRIVRMVAMMMRMMVHNH